MKKNLVAWVFAVVVVVFMIVAFGLGFGLKNMWEWIELSTTIFALAAASYGIGWLRISRHQTIWKIVKIAGKIAVNISFIFLGFVVIAGRDECHSLLRAALGYIGFIACGILINWVMNGGLGKWTKEQERSQVNTDLPQREENKATPAKEYRPLTGPIANGISC